DPYRLVLEPAQPIEAGFLRGGGAPSPRRQETVQLGAAGDFWLPTSHCSLPTWGKYRPFENKFYSLFSFFFIFHLCTRMIADAARLSLLGSPCPFAICSPSRIR